MPKKDVHEKRNMMKIVPDTTKLADEEAADSSTAHPDLEELIEIFGQDYGLKLYREGVDIEEARKYKELKDKFDIPTPEAETTELNEEEEKVVEETVVEKKEEEETTGLKSVLTKLSSKIDGLTAEVTKLKKIVPRGETAAVSHGLDPAPEPESPKPASNLQRMAAKYKGA